MKCPNCDVFLMPTERQQIEIDFCPQCRGVWLDRGELDKLIERAVRAPSAVRLEPPRPELRDDYYETRKPRKKRKNHFEELFDF
ncbi:MAG: zf-TFIIB domain-containing protein [Fimbriimonadaceae bacterium]